MKHLTDAEFVDLIDGTLPAARARHADACEACLERVVSLRAALDGIRQVEGGEPSPLFWDHFAARVSGAIADEPLPATAPDWFERLRNPAVTWAAAASLAMLLMVGALWRATVSAPVPVSQPSAAMADRAAGRDALDIISLDDDPAWAEVRAAADHFVWEDAEEIGIAARPGSAERAVLELSGEERAELARLLESELKRSGA